MDKLIHDFSFGLFFWQALILIILLILLAKFAWKPIMTSITEREEGIKNALQAAENAKQEMESLEASNKNILQEARLERDNMLKEAREIKEKMIAEAKAEAQAQAAKMIEQAKIAIVNEKNTAMNELKQQVASLSINIAEKIVKNELTNKEAQTQLAEKMLGDVKLN